MAIMPSLPPLPCSIQPKPLALARRHGTTEQRRDLIGRDGLSLRISLAKEGATLGIRGNRVFDLQILSLAELVDRLKIHFSGPITASSFSGLISVVLIIASRRV